MNNILIDSDILIDFFLQREPFLKDAIRILSYCENKKVNGFVSGLIISNTYYIISKHFQHKMIMSEFKRLLTFLDVVIINKDITLHAINSEFTNFEDALQNFASESEGSITTIVTRNIKYFKKSKLSVLTPEMFLKTL